MNAEGFLLDLDNTLYDYEAAHKPASIKTFTYLAERTGIAFDTINSNYKAARSRIHAQLHGQAASHSRLLYFQYLLEQLNIPPYELALSAERCYWDEFFENMVLRPHCLSFLKSLAPRPVTVITDLTANIQLKKIVHLKLQPYITGIVTSEEAGCEKPGKRIFELAIAKTEKEASKICMIGDNWHKDILGALEFGMSCLWLNIQEQEQEQEQKAQALPASVIEFKDFSAIASLVNSNA